MKKLFVAAVAVVNFVTANAQVIVPDYVRGSIYSIRLDAPSSSKQDFSKEIGIMTNVFDTLDYKHQYRKYNAFQAGERLLKNTELPDVNDDEVMAIATINGKKKASDDDKYAAQILKYLNNKKVGRDLVSKWFSKPTNTDLSKLDVDNEFTNIIQWGLLSLSEDEKIANQDAKMSNSDAAIMLTDQLLGSTYVLVTRYDFATPAEQIQDNINDKLAPLYAKLEKAPAMLKGTIQGTIDSQVESLKQSLEATIKLNAVSAKSYLFKLKWASLKDFDKYINNPADFENAADEFPLEYITTTKGTNVLVTELGGQKINVDKAVSRASLKVLNKNVNRLAQQYEPFAPIERLYTEEGTGTLYVKVGTQDGITNDSKFTALKKEGDKLVAGPTLSVLKGGLWNNNTEEDNIEENTKTAESSDSNLLVMKLAFAPVQHKAVAVMAQPSFAHHVQRLGVLKKK